MKEYRIIFKSNNIEFLYANNDAEGIEKAKKMGEIHMVIREDDCEVIYYKK